MLKYTFSMEVPIRLRQYDKNIINIFYNFNEVL